MGAKARFHTIFNKKQQNNQMKNQGLGDKENIKKFKEKPVIICKTLQMLMKSNVPWKKKHFL